MTDPNIREQWQSATADAMTAADAAAREIEAVTPTTDAAGIAIWNDALTREGSIRDLLLLDGGMLLLESANREGAAEWGFPLAPTRQINGEPVRVDDLSDNLEFFAELRASSPRAEVAARWNDLRWLRWRRFPAVVPAINSYLSAAADAALGDALDRDRAVGAYRRAADLALRTNQRRPEVCLAVRAAIDRWAAARESLLVHDLVDAAADVLTSEPAETKTLAERIYAMAHTPAASTNGRQLLEAVERLSRAGGAPELGTEARRARAASFEREATGKPGLVAIHFLRQAIDLYQQIGDTDGLARLRPKYEQSGQEALGQLHSFEGTVTVTRAEIEAAVDQMRLGTGPSLEGFLAVPFELGFLDDWANVRQRRLAEDAEHPLVSLFGRTSLEADGRIQPEPDPGRDPEEHARARDVAYFGRQAGFKVATLETMYLVELRNRGSWSATLLTTAIALVDEDLADACWPGIVRFEAGDYWNAAHSLVPQLERALRSLGRLVGADQTRFGRNEALRWAPLEQLLEDAGLRAALGVARSEALKALFVDPQGPNWRNNIAHGAMATDASPAIPATGALLSILAVANFVATARRDRQPRSRSAEETSSTSD